jgi:hypothetical protein
MTDYVDREQAMQDIYSGYYDYGSHVSNAEPVGLVEGIREITMMAALAVGGVMVVPAVASAVTAVMASAAYSSFRIGYGFYKRPIITTMVRSGVRGAETLMGISKAYSYLMLGLAVADIRRNINLARSGEYTKLGINVFGPPGSLFAYNNYMSRNKTIEDAREAFKQISMPVNSPDSPKSYQQGEDSGRQRNSKSYRPKSGHRCATGYRKINGMCVKR